MSRNRLRGLEKDPPQTHVPLVLYRGSGRHPHLSRPEQGLDVVLLQGQNVPAGAQRLFILLQLELSRRQVVQTLDSVVAHLLFLVYLRAVVITTICTEESPSREGLFLSLQVYLKDN